MAQYARDEINNLGGYYAYSREIINGDTIFDFDISKLSVYTLDLGLAGIEVYDILRDEYDIQIEFGDLSNILAYISVGDSYGHRRLVGALSEIARLYKRDKTGMIKRIYQPPCCNPPKTAFYSEKESLPISQSRGRISGEFVMSYPPGIPILAPGEEITGEIIDYIEYSKEKGCFLTGTEDLEVETIKVVRL